MVAKYVTATIEQLNHIEEQTKNTIRFSLVDDEVKEVHITLGKDRTMTIIRDEIYDSILNILLPETVTFYELKYPITLEDGSEEIVAKQFNSKDERELYKTLKLSTGQREKSKEENIEAI